MSATQAPCPVLWCERDHATPGASVNPCHYVVIQRQRWFAGDKTGGIQDTELCASLSWQENSQRGPYFAIEASGNGRRRLAIVGVGVAQAIGEVLGVAPHLYGEGGHFLAESIGLGTGILA